MLKIKNNHNENLAGILDENVVTKNLVIICHGSRSSKNGSIQVSLAEELKSEYNVFRFDCSGNGESEGDLEDSTYSKDIDDLLSIVDYFIDKGFNIKAVIGHSKSGTEVLLSSEKLAQRNVDKIIAIAPRIFLKNANEMKELERQREFFDKNGYYLFSGSRVKHKVTKKYIDDLSKYLDVRDHYKPLIKTFIIHGTDDSLIKISESESFVEKFKDVDLATVNGADHGFKGKLKELGSNVNKIFDKN